MDVLDGALYLTGVRSRVYFLLMPTVLVIGSGSSVTLTKIKQLLEIDESHPIKYLKGSSTSRAYFLIDRPSNVAYNTLTI